MSRLTAFATCLLVAGCSQNGTKDKELFIDKSNFDTSVALEDDFYQYATGGWQKKHPLKPEYARYGAFDILRDNNELRIKNLFKEMSEEEAIEGSLQSKIANLYKMGLDSTRLNKEGKQPLMNKLKKIESITDREELSEQIAAMQLVNLSPFFGLYVGADMMNSSQNILNLYQSGLGMGNRDYYLDEENQKIRDAYRYYILQLAQLSGYSPVRAEEIYQSVMAIEKSLAKYSSTKVELRDPYKNYNIQTKEDILDSYNAIDWKSYFDELGIKIPEKVNVGQVPFFEKMNKLIQESSLDQLKDYLAFHTMNGAAPFLSDDYTKVKFDFYGKTLTGKEEQQPRWKRALNVTNSILSEAVGELYVEHYFPAEHKHKMEKMVKQLQVALGQHIDSLPWMSAETKEKAHEKLAMFQVKIGYPDKWKDYNTLQIDTNVPYIQNIEAAAIWESKDILNKIGKPVDKTEWLMSPQTVNAYYNPTTNEICFPAAILQPPFFNPDADDAVNYGAIGVVIGHEMTHGFDDQGRQFDKEGNLKNWWTDEDAERFKERADKLVEQFNQIFVLDSLRANGALTLGENIADQGGLRVAYTALQNVSDNNDKVLIDELTPEQRFYLSYATLWGQNIRNAEIERLTKIDPHSLGKWRVNATLPNINEFYEAFNITEGNMYKKPSERVIIW